MVSDIFSRTSSHVSTERSHRLTLFYSAVLSVMLAGFGILFYHALGLFMERSITKELEDQVAFLHSHMRVENGKVQLAFNPDNREEAYLVHVATRFYEVFELPSGNLLRPVRRA